MTRLKLTNSLTRQKEDFIPLDESNVRLYACGPTVYDYAHLGNARMAVVFDLLTRVLQTLYPKVTYASNITDIEDKIITRARQSGESIDTITKRYTKIYNEDMGALGNMPPTIQPLATEHIPEMIAQIDALIQNGHAYEADGHVLFNVPSFEKYGGLSGRSRDEQVAGARVEVATYKKDPADFVLWKPSTGDEPGWDSPYGFGRPGWHIECSVMAEKHLSLPFDIHGGGADLKFPHHENEIAQSCCAHGNQNDLSAFAKVWVHNGFLTVDGEKMSKSLGNFTLTHDLLKQGIHGDVIRMALLSAHYRKPLDWNDNLLHQAGKTVTLVYKTLSDLKNIPQRDLSDEEKSETLSPLYDDLNSPLLISSFHQLVKDLANADDSQKSLLKGKINLLAETLGFFEKDAKAFLNFGRSEIDSDKVEELITKRNEAKANKDYATADSLRDELLGMGIEIKDTANGTEWSQAN